MAFRSAAIVSTPSPGCEIFTAPGTEPGGYLAGSSVTTWTSHPRLSRYFFSPLGRRPPTSTDGGKWYETRRTFLSLWLKPNKYSLSDEFPTRDCCGKDPEFQHGVRDVRLYGDAAYVEGVKADPRV